MNYLEDSPTTRVVPNADSDQSKSEQIAQMFNRISGKYDFLNHLLTIGIDKGWRKKAIQSLAATKPRFILDIATGTGDLAIEALRINPEKVTGIDISEGMLDIGRQKIREKGLADKINLAYGDCEKLEFHTGTVDAITCAYGVRNFEHLQKGLREMYRVLKPGGKIAILEFSTPRQFPIRQFYGLYFRYILPTIGRMVSKDKTAYRYLPNSVAAFPEGKEFCNILQVCGFTSCSARPLTFGMTTLYNAEKPN